MSDRISTLVMFGATGDLARRMLLPSLYGLDSDGLLPDGLDSINPTVVIQAWPYAPPPPAVLARGVTAITAAVRRDPGHLPLAQAGGRLPRKAASPSLPSGPRAASAKLLAADAI